MKTPGTANMNERTKKEATNDTVETDRGRRGEVCGDTSVGNGGLADTSGDGRASCPASGEAPAEPTTGRRRGVWAGGTVEPNGGGEERWPRWGPGAGLWVSGFWPEARRIRSWGPRAGDLGRPRRTTRERDRRIMMIPNQTGSSVLRMGHLNLFFLILIPADSFIRVCDGCRFDPTLSLGSSDAARRALSGGVAGSGGSHVGVELRRDEAPKAVSSVHRSIFPARSGLDEGHGRRVAKSSIR